MALPLVAKLVLGAGVLLLACSFVVTFGSAAAWWWRVRRRRGRRGGDLPEALYRRLPS